MRRDFCTLWIEQRPIFEELFAKLMRVKIDIRDHVAVLTVSGTLMSGPTVVPFQHYVEEVMADGITNVVVDFSRVKWFGSTMLGVLAVSLEMLRNAGGDLRLAGIANRMESLMMVGKLSSHFRTLESVDAAVESFVSDPPGRRET